MKNEEEESSLDANLAKLIHEKNLPPTLSAEQKGSMFASLQARQKQLAIEQETTERFPMALLLPILGGIAAAIVFGFQMFSDPKQPPAETPPKIATPAEPERPVPVAPSVPQVEHFAATDQTERFTLRDGSVAVAELGTRFSEIAPRHLKLDSGALYLIVAKSDKPLIVNTSDGKAQALGTRFMVSSRDGKSRVAVAQGLVKLSNDAGAVDLVRGQEGVIGDDGHPFRRPAPRVSHLVSWARDALKDDARLPDQKRSGLVAIDPYGQSAKLELRDYTLDVYIEDGVARTTIDQTFFNHYPSNTEGTFYFPLPPGAAVSRMAMYVNGKRNEAGMVERHRGQEIYNDIKYANRDPALLEHLEGNLYKLRIFPLEGRQEKRIFISFTQSIEELYGNLRYWLPMDHTEANAGKFNIHVRIRFGAELYDPESSTHKFATEIDGDDLVLNYTAENLKPDQDLLLSLLPKEKAANPVQTSNSTQGEHAFFHTRIRPEITGEPVATPRQWFIINDSSASRSKADLSAQSHIIGRIIAEGDDRDQLAVLESNTLTERLTEGLVPLGGDASRNALLKTKSAMPLGATNIEKGISDALDWIAETGAENPIIVYIGDGMATDGTTSTNELTGLLDSDVEFIGIAVGKKADLSFLRAAADATGGAALVMNPDEDLNWRVFDMLASFNTPRLTNLSWELPNPEQAVVYGDRSTMSEGEVLTIVCRASKGDPPGSMTLRGELGGKPWEMKVDLTGARDEARFVPRFWAQRHLEELLKDGEEHRDEIVRLSKKHYVATPHTSLIVLENDKMYADYSVEKGRDDHWAAYPAPAEIPVVREPGGPLWWALRESENSEISTNPQTAQEIIGTLLPIRPEDPALSPAYHIPTHSLRGAATSSWFWGAESDRTKMFGGGGGKFFNPSITGDWDYGFSLSHPGVNQRMSHTIINYRRTIGRQNDSRRGLHRIRTERATAGLGFVPRLEAGEYPDFYYLDSFGTGIGRGYTPTPSLTDLAIGLGTSSADRRSVVELRFGREKHGSLTADAREQIQAAENNRSPQEIDGITTTPDGRQVGRTMLPMYVEELVVSDGKTWWHIYKDLGFAARRPVTPSNLSAIQSAVPHWPPSLTEMEAHWDVTLKKSDAESFEIALADPETPETILLLKINHDGNLLESRLFEKGKTVAREKFSYEGDTITVTNQRGLAQSYTATTVEVDDQMFVVALDELVILDAPLRKPAFYQKKLAETEDEKEKTNLLRHLIAATMSDSGIPANDRFDHTIRYFEGVSTLGDQSLPFVERMWGALAPAWGPSAPCFSHLKEFGEFFRTRPTAEMYTEFLEKWPDSPVLPYLVGTSRAAYVPLLESPSAHYLASERIAQNNSGMVDPVIARKIAVFRAKDAESGSLNFVSRPIRSCLQKANQLDKLVEAYRARMRKDESLNVLFPILDLGIQLGDDDSMRDACLPLVLDKVNATKSWKEMADLAALFAGQDKNSESCDYYEQAIALAETPSAELLQAAAKSAQGCADERFLQWERDALMKLDTDRYLVNSQEVRSRFDIVIASAIKAGRIEFAKRFALEGERIAPKSNFRYTALSQHYFKAGQKEESWRWLSSLIDRSPKDAKMTGAVARVLRNLGEMEKSQAFYALAHSYDSAEPQWLTEQAKTLYQAGEIERGDEVFQRLRNKKWAPGLQRQIPNEIRAPLVTPRQQGRLSNEDASDGWQRVGFDDGDWAEDEGFFTLGKKDSELWENPILVRKRFDVPHNPRELILIGSIHGATCEIYLNGTLIGQMNENGEQERNSSQSYTLNLRGKQLEAVVEGENVLAYRCKKIGKRPELQVGLYQLFKAK